MQSTRGRPRPENSGEVTRSTGPHAVANETSVGGTSSCSKEPDDGESLPPIEPTSVSICAMSAPAHGGDRLTPTRGFFAQAFEVFLERIVGVLALEARSYELRERFDDRKVSAIELVRLGKIRVEAPGHA